MKNLSYNEIISHVSDVLEKNKKRNEVLLVCIEGLSNSGKTTFSKKIQTELKKRKRNCVVIEGDEFHVGRDKIKPLYAKYIKEPKKVNYNYIFNFWDFKKLKDELINPILKFNKSQDLELLVELKNILKDKVSNTEHNKKYKFSKDSIVLVPGMYLRQIEGFKYVVYLNIDCDISVGRKITRGKSVGLKRSYKATSDMVKLVEIPIMKEHNKKYRIKKGIVVDMNDFDKISVLKEFK